MADTGIFCTTAEVQAKVGANANSTYNTETYINMYVAQAESFINCYCRFNFSDVYSSLNTDVKKILTEAASNLAASYVISADMSGFSQLAEAQTKLDYLKDRADAAIALLKDKNVQEFITGV
jgi:hypothetical protein